MAFHSRFCRVHSVLGARSGSRSARHWHRCLVVGQDWCMLQPSCLVWLTPTPADCNGVVLACGCCAESSLDTGVSCHCCFYAGSFFAGIAVLVRARRAQPTPSTNTTVGSTPVGHCVLLPVRLLSRGFSNGRLGFECGGGSVSCVAVGVGLARAVGLRSDCVYQHLGAQQATIRPGMG